ncbi:hypothetical protein [Streptomyces sp. RPT161]|uniref:hypothetical protein n=1 Tax=Streptomyces sp. RPT161 TaxID=3015993 RepID=UPI0022B88F27|nr:hypothetical protein [Streptomyces sp. RPT161]
MLHAREIAFATPKDLGGTAGYRRVCQVAGLRPVPDGYGLLLAVDDDGAQVTLVTADVEYVRAIASAGPSALAGLELSGEAAEKFIWRDGWPDEWI